MNYKFLDGYCPRQKRGVDSIITGALGGLGLIGDTIGQTSTNAYNAHLQQEENQKNREFQVQEADKQRQFQQAQTNQLLRYNSAPEQVKRLQQAGISAATAFSNSSGSAGSAMSAPMGAIPSGSSGVSPVSNPLRMMSAFSAQGAFMKSLAEAYKSSEEGSMVRPLAEAQIKKQLADLNLTQLQAEGQEIANMIASKTGLRSKEAQIQNVIASTDLLVAQKAKEIAAKGLTEAQMNREIEQLVGDVYDNERKRFEALLGKSRYKMSLIDLKYHEAEVVEGIKTMISQQNVNSATAENQRSSAKLTQTENQLKTIELDIKQKHSYDYAETVVSEWEKQKDINEAVAKEARLKLKALKQGTASAKEVDEFLRWLSNAIGVNVVLSN